MSKTVLLTGAAGFIGFSTAKALLERGDEVVGIDNINDYYDPNLKLARLKILEENPNFRFQKQDISSPITLDDKFDAVCHLAGQAGVRHSIERPSEFLSSNVIGTFNMLEFAKKKGIKDFVFASSSSVYGNSKEIPFRETQKVNAPVSFYAATKAACELLAHSHYKTAGINAVGLRFFTVYGPWGRPDMIPIKFAKRISEGQSIEVYNNGNMKRDFTYIDDIVAGTVAAIDKAGELGFEIINLGRGEQINLMSFIRELETNLDKVATKTYMGMQPGDVLATSADISKAKELLGYNPQTSVSEGVRKFVDWYKEYYKTGN